MITSKMPELPEVETLRRQLDGLCGQTVLEVKVWDEVLLEVKGVEGERLEGLRRHGKVLVFSFGKGEVSLKLGMTGRLKLGVADVGPRVSFLFSNGVWLHFIDRRRLGRFVMGDGTPRGLDALSEGIGLFWWERAKGSLRPVKAYLMDQGIVCGIGNIYASEILFLCRVHPLQPVGELTRHDWVRMERVTKRVLSEAIQMRGTTVSDWRDLYGLPGLYQLKLRVYGREGSTCPRCKGVIEKLYIDGRGTWYCPDCQRLMGVSQK